MPNVWYLVVMSKQVPCAEFSRSLHLQRHHRLCEAWFSGRYQNKAGAWSSFFRFFCFMKPHPRHFGFKSSFFCKGLICVLLDSPEALQAKDVLRWWDNQCVVWRASLCTIFPVPRQNCSNGFQLSVCNVFSRSFFFLVCFWVMNELTPGWGRMKAFRTWPRRRSMIYGCETRLIKSSLFSSNLTCF